MKKSVSLFILVLLAGLSSCGSGTEQKKSSEKAHTAEKARTPQAEPGPEASDPTAASPALSGPELITQLTSSAFDGNIKGVKDAIEAGADVNGIDEEGRTALMFSSFNGFSEIVLLLLDEGASIDRRDPMGRTSLLYAATGPFPETVRILLDKGAEPNVVDSDEHFSPLMHAAAEGNLDVVKILLKAGSDHTLKDVDGDNAATFARQAGHIAVADHLDAL